MDGFQEKFASMIADAGFQKVEYENLVGGVVSIHSGLKIWHPYELCALLYPIIHELRVKIKRDVMRTRRDDLYCNAILLQGLTVLLKHVYTIFTSKSKHI